MNRSLNETTRTTITSIPCNTIKQNQSYQKPKQHPSSKKHQHTLPTSVLPESLHFQKVPPNLFNIFHNLSFPDIPSNNHQDHVPTLSDDYQINSNMNNEQFQLLKTQFHAYLNEIESNSLSHVIHLLSLYNHLNNEQIRDLLRHIGYSNLTGDDINRYLMNDRRITLNEQFENLRTILNEHNRK
ncbi:hypothetical protein I4U23_029211 [Adineta vaga]|nr:hypothetical protein I4U23_029211 [Adineta vaga]